MFLTKLELHGFKSFVDATDVSFGNGITAVVGPNGCGKTNISDAIRWRLICPTFSDLPEASCPSCAAVRPNGSEHSRFV